MAMIVLSLRVGQKRRHAWRRRCRHWPPRAYIECAGQQRNSVDGQPKITCVLHLVMLGSFAMDAHYLNESDLADRMERNLAEHACHLHRSMTGAAVTETGDLLVADSSLDDDTFNIVAAARFTAATATARITETARKLAHTGRRFSWWVGPASTPPDLTARLTTAGLPASEHETAMWAELDDTLPLPAAQGLDIQTVATPEQLADYATVLAANWTPPADTVRRFFARTAPQALATHCTARYLVGYMAGHPVCSAEVLRHAGVTCSLFNRFAPKAVRRQLRPAKPARRPNRSNSASPNTGSPRDSAANDDGERSHLALHELR